MVLIYDQLFCKLPIISNFSTFSSIFQASGHLVAMTYIYSAITGQLTT